MSQQMTDLNVERDVEAVLTDEDGEWLPVSEKDLLAASGAEETPASAAMIRIGSQLIDLYRTQDEDSPCRDDQDLKNDLVYRLGVRKGIRLMLELPAAAREIIKTQREGA